SWTEYFMAIGLLLVIYYLLIGLRYHTNDLKRLLSGERRASDLNVDDFGNDTDNAASENEGSDEFEEVESLIERLRSVIADAAQRKLVYEEFRHYLRLLFKEYPSIRQAPIRSSVNELVV